MQVDTEVSQELSLTQESLEQQQQATNQLLEEEGEGGCEKKRWRLAGPQCTPESSQLLPCPGCPYGGPRVGTRGSLESSLVFVGEAPGREEIRHRLPLVGPSGKVFWGTFPVDEALEEYGLKPEEFLILNALQCVPPRSKDMRKNQSAVLKGNYECHNRLLLQVQLHPRKLIVAMGNHALWSLTGNYTYKITQVRGQLIPSPLAELGILPVLHPAALLRGTGNYRQYMMDIGYAIDLVRGLPKKEPVNTYYMVCDTPEKVYYAIRRLIKKPYLYCDTETAGFNRFKDETLALGVAYDPRFVYIFPGAISKERAHELGAHKDWYDGIPSSLPHLREFFKKYRGRLVWHNGKYDISFTRKEGYESRVDEDTMLASYVLDEQRGIHDLEQVGADILGAPDYKYIIKKYVPRKSDSYSKIPKKVLFNYLALDVGTTAGIFPILRRRVREDPHLEKLYTRLLLPASDQLWWVEQRGITVNVFAAKRQQRRLQKELDEADAVVSRVAARYGVESINAGSPQQVASLLYDKLKMKPPPGMGRSTAADVLDSLPDHPVVRALKSRRKAAKMKGTYADAILNNVQDDGRVHPTYLLHGTRTGRLAHKIIANIPRDKRIRGMFQAAPGYVLIKADIDQAELRSLATLSGDRELCAIYRDNTRKLHKEVANEIWGTPGDSKGSEAQVRMGHLKWGEEEYMRAKALNFGIVYGRQAPSIAEEFGISVREAQGYIDAWKKKFPRAWAFIEFCRNSVTEGRTLITPFGSKKRHWIVTRENLVALQNEASNFPHQNIASNVTLSAAIKVGPTLRERDAWIVNLVHDEILTECPDDPATIEWASKLIMEAVEEVAKEWGITRVPFKADTSVGRRWGIYRGKCKRGSDWDLRFNQAA